MDDFYAQLNEVYGTHDLIAIQQFFETESKKAEPVERVMILNEYIGFLRETSQYEKGNEVVQSILDLVTVLGIDQSAEYGTILLNIATFLKASKDYKQADLYYQQVEALYSKYLDEKDMRLASFYNNYGLYLMETQQFDRAKEYLTKALNITVQTNRYVELATAYTNLGQIYFKLNDIKTGIQYMEKGVAVYEAYSLKDPHYAASLSGLAQAYFYEKEYQKSYDLFNKALKEIEMYYGTDCQSYVITQQNLNLVAKYIRKPISGLSLSKQYYETFGKKMIHDLFPDYEKRIAIGSVGKGSDRIGCDDLISQDHDFGCGFCMFLVEEDYKLIGKELQQAYDKLPDEFMGYHKCHSIHDQRDGVYEIHSFYHSILEHYPQTLEDWNQIDSWKLLEACNGEVFFDDLKVFTHLRNQIAQYPESVRNMKLGYALFRAGQAGQYNYFRMKQREDRYSMALCQQEFIQGVIDILYLLNNQYKPLYKWQIKRMDQFVVCKDIVEDLKQCLVQFDEEMIEKICIKIVAECNRQNISDSKDPFLVSQKDEVWKHV